VKYGLEFRRCLVDLDVRAARHLWALVHPGWDQPQSDYEMLALLHLARTRAWSIHPRLREYSRQWLAERQSPGVQAAVGVATKALDPAMKHRARAVREAMEDSVMRSHRAGLDLDVEAPEVQRRMLVARRKERGGNLFGWLKTRP